MAIRAGDRPARFRQCAFASAVLFFGTIASAADFNGDGNQDLLWRSNAGNPIVWQMQGLGIAARQIVGSALDAGSTVVAGGTFFSGGGAGILWLNSQHQLALWRLDGNVLQSACTIEAGIDPTSDFLGAGDLDGDGLDDVAWRRADGSIELNLLDGCATPQTLQLAASADASWTFAGIGTVDGQHGAIFWRDADGNVVLWTLPGGSTVSSSTLDGTTVAGWSIAAIADFDGDGRSDILWRDPSGTAARMWFMTNSTFTVGTVAASGASVFAGADSIFAGTFDSALQPSESFTPDATVINATDIDGNGRADLVIEYANGTTALWLMDGATVEATGNVPPLDDMPFSALTGWRQPLERPQITLAGGQVGISWNAIPGTPPYTVYASAANDPAQSGIGIASATASLAFGRSDAGYADKRYFAVSAAYHGIRLPPSPEAYIVEFTPLDLPYWGAMAVGDIDNDGCSDILGALGDCQGHFQILAEADMGLGALRAAQRVYRDLRFADLDGDGIDDLIANTYAAITSTSSRVLFFRGIGENQFVEDPDFDALQIGGFGETIVIADFNNDGYLDVFLPEYTFHSGDEHCWLLINDGQGHFTDVADAAGVAMRNVSLYFRPEGAQALDINGDGRIDLFAGSSLFINNGNLTFTNVGPQIDSSGSVVGPSPWGLPAQFDEGAKFIDLDNSGQLALALNMVYSYASSPATSAHGIRVLEFNGVDHFTEKFVMPQGLAMNESFGLDAADIDGDGRTDLVVAGGCDPNHTYGDANCSVWGNPHVLPLLFVNRDGVFVPHDFYDDGRSVDERGWNDLQTFADFDASGTIDVVSRFGDSRTTNGGYLTVLANQARSDATIHVALLGANGARNQAGRVVRVSPVSHPDVIMTQVVDGGSGYMANGPYELTFATPYPGAYTVTVRFATASYATTAHAGDRVTMRADGTYTIQ